MAGTKAQDTTKAEADEPTVGNVPDARDTSPRAKADLSGKRVRAIPSVITKNGDRSTTIEIRRSDFKSADIDHPTVQWDFRRDNFTVKVGDRAGQISEAAAEFLTSKHPQSFEYIENE